MFSYRGERYWSLSIPIAIGPFWILGVVPFRGCAIRGCKFKPTLHMRESERLAIEYRKRAVFCLSEADRALPADRRFWEALGLELLRLASAARALRVLAGFEA